MNPPATIFSPQALTRTTVCVLALTLVMLTSCGKKEEPAPPAPAPPVVEQAPPPPPAPVPEAPQTAAAPPQAPGMREPAETKKTGEPPAPAKAESSQRSPADAAAWERWDRAAERMRDIGATVRDSTDPRRLEVVVNTASDSEVRTIARAAYTALGGGEVSVLLFDASGAQVGQATIEGVKGR